MVYTCNIKALESTKDGKKMNLLCIVDRNHKRSVVALDHFRSFKGISLIVEYIQHRKRGGNTYPGERELLCEIKKRKVS